MKKSSEKIFAQQISEVYKLTKLKNIEKGSEKSLINVRILTRGDQELKNRRWRRRAIHVLAPLRAPISRNQVKKT